jgi:hypothetical protein
MDFNHDDAITRSQGKKLGKELGNITTKAFGQGEDTEINIMQPSPWLSFQQQRRTSVIRPD